MATERLKTASFGPGFIGSILIFCAFAVAAWIIFRCIAPTPTYEEKRAADRRAKVAAINLEAAQKLYGAPQWIDKTKGTVQLPIDEAMNLVVADYQSKPVHPSTVKVENPYPFGMGAVPVGAEFSGLHAAPPGAAVSPPVKKALPAASPAAAKANAGASPAAAAKASPAAVSASPSPEVKK